PRRAHGGARPEERGQDHRRERADHRARQADDADGYALDAAGGRPRRPPHHDVSGANHPRLYGGGEAPAPPGRSAGEVRGRPARRTTRPGRGRDAKARLRLSVGPAVPLPPLGRLSEPCGRMTEWIIKRSTERITQAANAIRLKDYSSLLKRKETPE